MSLLRWTAVVWSRLCVVERLVQRGPFIFSCFLPITWAEAVFRHALLLGVCNKDFHGCPFSFPSTAAPPERRCWFHSLSVAVQAVWVPVLEERAYGLRHVHASSR